MIPSTANGYQVTIPTLATGTFSFMFSSVFGPGLFQFLFVFSSYTIDGQSGQGWKVWVQLPSGEIRPTTVNANAIAWSGFSDYLIQFKTVLEYVGQNDLPSVQLWVYLQ